MICTVLHAGLICGHVIYAAEVFAPDRRGGALRLARQHLSPLHLPFALGATGYEVQVRRVLNCVPVSSVVQQAQVIRAEDLGVLPF